MHIFDLGVATLAFGLWLHASLALVLVWALEKLRIVRANAAREWLWRSVPAVAVVSVILRFALVSAQMPVDEVRVPPQARVAHADAKLLEASKAAPKNSVAAPSMPATSASTWAPKNVVLSVGWIGEAIAAGWLAGMLMLLIGIARSAWRVRRLARQSAPIEHGRVAIVLADVCAAMGSATPRVALSRELDSPVALSGARLLLPPWTLDLPAAQLRAVLAHEVWHLRRRDPQWRLAMALCRALLWPVPCMGLVLRRLDLLAEFACDAQAAALSGGGRPLAECLAYYLERRAVSSAPMLAVAMAAPRSPLLQRAERLLEGTAVTYSRLSPAARFAPLAIAIALALCVPAVVLRASEPAGKRTSVTVERHGDSGCHVIFGSCNSTSVHEHDGVVRIVAENGSHRLRATFTGDVRFSDDERDISQIADGGSVSVEEKRDGWLRRIELKKEGDAIARHYFLDDSEVPANAELTQWFSSLIPQMLRETGADAEDRVARFMKRGGVDAVLAEIAQIDSDNVRGRYLIVLAESKALSADELEKTLALCDGISSDYELRRVLDVFYAKQKLDSTGFLALLHQSTRIGSDYERAQILTALAPRAVASAQTRDAWFEAADEIGSDYEKRRTLSAATLGSADEPTLAALLHAASGVGSDYEKRVTLGQIASVSADAEPIARAYTDVVREINSDFERRQALMMLLSKGHLQRDGALAVLDTVDMMDSDFESRQVLVALAQVMPTDAAVLERYHQVAAKLSDFERRQVERAVAGVAG